MRGIKHTPLLIFSRCLGARIKPPPSRVQGIRYASDNAPPKQPNHGLEKKEQGAMSRRLEEMSNESLESGGRSARKAVEEAGFSEELKARLEQKIANASFRSDNAGAFAQMDMPSSAGRGTREAAAASPWTGTESVEDASLRMLNDSHRPLRVRGTSKTPGFRGPPSKVDTGRPAQKVATGARLANARDKTSVYSILKDENMTQEERDRYRKELKERFQPGSRIAPASVQAITSLANQRIEDAIARGQFRNLPRGKHIERDYNASNPFLDTTEYFMNKIIQKQEIVPPWIEKQQELVSTATRFRSQLRASWRRHVSRTIASRGGTLEQQLKLADEYAFAETVENPSKKKKTEKFNAINDQGRVSQITLAGELKPMPVDDPHSAEEEFKAMEQAFNDDGTLKAPEQEVTMTVETTASTPTSTLACTSKPEQSSTPATELPSAPRQPTVRAFRDPEWSKTELSYHTLAIANLNSLNRSYNLMAPQLAQKPYFTLERELNACYADVAPQIASAIRERSLTPKIRGVEVVGHKPGGVLEKFAMADKVQVFEERKPQYGFKEFWKDLFAGGEKR